MAGILAEGRPDEGWAVLGIGVNVALRIDELPPELHDTAGTLGLTPADLEPTLARLLAALERALAPRQRRRCSRPTAPATRCAATRSRGRAAGGRPPASTAPGGWSWSWWVAGAPR